MLFYHDDILYYYHTNTINFSIICILHNGQFFTASWKAQFSHKHKWLHGRTKTFFEISWHITHSLVSVNTDDYKKMKKKRN